MLSVFNMFFSNIPTQKGGKSFTSLSKKFVEGVKATLKYLMGKDAAKFSRVEYKRGTVSLETCHVNKLLS